VTASTTIALELQGDCFAGAWAAHASGTTTDLYNVAESDLDRALSGYLTFRDPVGTDPRAEGAHGSAFDRVSALWTATRAVLPAARTTRRIRR
jgi:predicted metalloprotease